MPLSLKLFSIINNDADLLGSRKLEGFDQEKTTEFMLQFLREATTNQNPLSSELNEIIKNSNLIEKFSDMLKLNRVINSIAENCQQASERIRDRTYLKVANSITERIIKLDGETKDSLLLPGGWAGKPGHSMAYEFRKDQDCNVLFCIHNSGAGLEYHKRSNDMEKSRYHSVKAFKIPFESAKPEMLSYFIGELIKAQVEFKLPDSSVRKNRLYDENRLYNEVFPKISYLNAKEIEPIEVSPRYNDLITIGQRSGTCSEKCLHAILKSAMVNDEQARLVLFYFKKYSIEKFFSENKDRFDAKKAEQTLLAVENLARAIKKNPSILREETIVQTSELLKEIKTAVSHIIPKPFPNILNFNSNIRQIETSIITKSFKQNVLDYSIVMPNLISTVIEKEYDYRSLVASPCSLAEFKSAIFTVQSLINENQHKAAENLIEKILLNIPLTPEYFSAIKTSNDGTEFVNDLNDLLALYTTCCQKLDPKTNIGIKRTVTLLSVLGIINEVTNIENISIARSTYPFFGQSLINLLAILQKNPYMASMNPLYDKRLKCIESRLRETAKNYKFIYEYNVVKNRLEIYKKFINNHPQSDLLKKFLEKLFELKAELKYSMDQIYVIKGLNSVEDVTLVSLLEDIPASLLDEAHALDISQIITRLKLERQCEKICSNITSVLNAFSYGYLAKPIINNDEQFIEVVADERSKSVNYKSPLNYYIMVNNKLGQEKIQHPSIIAAIDCYDGRTSERGIKQQNRPNTIFADNSLLEKLTQGDICSAAILDASLQRSWRLLRANSELQIPTTLDYFEENPTLLKDKSIITFLQGNLFQPNLLCNSLLTNENLFTDINYFWNYLIAYFNRLEDTETLKDLYYLKYQFNQYLLNSDLSHFHESALTEIKNLHSQISKLPNNVYAKVILLTSIELIDRGYLDITSESLESLIDQFMLYNRLMNIEPVHTAEMIAEQDEIKRRFIKIAEKSLAILPEVMLRWVQKHSLATTTLQPTWIVNLDLFPLVLFNDVSGKEEISLNLSSGDLTENQEMLCILPARIKSSPIYKSLMVEESKITFRGCLISYPGIPGSHHRFRIETPSGNAYLFETPHLKNPYVLQKEITLEGKQALYELCTLINIHNNVLKTSLLGTSEIEIDLPASFFCESTTAWRNISTNEVYISRKDKQYLLKADNRLYELNKSGEQSGYQLVNYYSISTESSINSIFDLFKNFEDISMVEVVKKVNVGKDGPSLKISLPRYNLEFHAEYDESKREWVLSDSNNPHYLLMKDQTCPIVGYAGALFFENINTKEKKAYIPVQDFYVQSKEAQQCTSLMEATISTNAFGSSSSSKKLLSFDQGGSEDDFSTVYYHLTLDTSKESKRRLIGEVKDHSPESAVIQNDVIVPEGPFYEVDSESYMSIEYDYDLQAFKARTNEERLYLAYIYLCQHKSECAISYLNEIVKTGGLKGTKNELALIEKVFNGVPRFPKSAEIKNPRITAVKTQALSLLLHFINTKHHIELKSCDNSVHSKSSLVEKLEFERLQKFQNDLSQIIRNQFNKYYHVRGNIPSMMRISLNQEYEMLSYIFKNESKVRGPLGHRYRKLNAKYIALEKAYLDSYPIKHAPVLEQRASLNQKQLNTKSLHIETSQYQDKSFNFAIHEQSSERTGYIHRAQELSMTEVISLFNEPAKELKLPIPGISEHEFINQMKHYLSIALSNENANIEEREYIKSYCRNTLLAFRNQKKSLQTDLCTIIYSAIENPPIFKYTNLNSLDDLYDVMKGNVVTIQDKCLATILTEKIYNPSDEIKMILPFRKVVAGTFSYPLLDNNNYIKESELEPFIRLVQSHEDEKNAKIAEIISFEYPHDLRYVDAIHNLSEKDSQIGIIHHEYEDKFNDLVQTQLRSSQLRMNLKIKTSEFVEKLEPMLEFSKQSLLSFAQKGPSIAKEKMQFELEIIGRLKNRLEMKDLFRLYVLSDYDEYHKQTGLNEADINQLHQKIADHVQLLLLSQQYNRRLIELENCERSIENEDEFNRSLRKLGSVLFERNVCDFSNEPELQFLQMSQAMLVYPSRVEQVKKLLGIKPEDALHHNHVIQAMMGGGKSKIISPLACVCKANGSNLVIHQVKRSLFQTNLNDLNSTSLALFNQEAIPFEFNRSSPSSSADLKELYHKLQNVMVDRNYLVTTAESLQALELKYINLLDESPSEISSGFSEWERQVKWLDRTLQLIKYRGDRLIDEIHEENDPKKRLNYTIGLPDYVSVEDVTLQMKMFEFFSKVNFEQPYTFEDVLKGKHKITSQDEYDALFNNLAFALTYDILSPINAIIHKLSLTQDEKLIFSKYLLNQSNLITAKFSILSEREKMDLAFFKMQLSRILPHTLKSNLHESYGPSLNSKRDVIEKHIAIPYAANNSPNEGNEFGSFVECMNYTVQMVIKTGLSDEFVNHLIEQFILEAESEILESPSLKFNKTVASIKFSSLFSQVLNYSDLEQIKNDVHLKEQIISMLKQAPSFKRYALQEILIPKIKINTTVLSSNPTNCVSMTRTTQGMTGTPYNIHAMHRAFHFDNKAGLGIDGQTTELIRRKMPLVQPVYSFDCAQSFISQFDDQANIRCIIDVGAIFAGIPNEVVASSLAEYYKHDENMKYILFFDTKNKILHAMSTKSNEIIKLNTSDDKVISQLLKCKPNERFTYYDQANTIGADIVQDQLAEAIVTVSDKTTRSQLYQGIRRMRRLDEQQKFRFAFPSELMNSAPFSNLSPMQIIDNTYENEIHEALDAHLTGAVQNFHDIVRENLLSRIYSCNKPSDKSRLMKYFKSIFESKVEINHFLQDGNVFDHVDSELYFHNLQEQYLLRWQQLLKNANIDIDPVELSKMQAELQEVKIKAVHNCRDTIISDYQAIGSTVEVENDTKIDIKQDTKLSISIDSNSFRPLKDPSPNQDGQPPLIEIACEILESYRRNGSVEQVNNVLNYQFPENKLDVSNELYVTKSFLHTLKSYYYRKLFDIYTKPIELVMMMQHKAPPYELKAVILNKEIDISLGVRYPEYDVWFVSPSGRFLAGDKPQMISNQYDSLLEEIKFLNGDCRRLALQQAPLKWINESKMDFLKSTILQCHPDKAEHYPRLLTRVSVYNKIVRFILANPNEDFLNIDWNIKFPGYSDLKVKLKSQLIELMTAFTRINVTNLSDISQEWIDTHRDEYRPLIQNRFDKIKFSQFISKGIANGELVSNLVKDIHRFNIDFTVNNQSGITPLHQAIMNKQILNVSTMLSYDLAFDAKDVKGNNAIDLVFEMYSHDSDTADKLLKEFIKATLSSHNQETRKRFITYIIHHAPSELIDRILCLYDLHDHDLKSDFNINSKYEDEKVKFALIEHGEPTSHEPLKTLMRLHYIVSMTKGSADDLNEFHDRVSSLTNDDFSFFKYQQYSLLHTSIRWHNPNHNNLLPFIAKCIDKSENLNSLICQDKTALMFAIEADKPDVVKLLLNRDVDPTVGVNGIEPLKLAILQLAGRKGSFQVVIDLLERLPLPSESELEEIFGSIFDLQRKLRIKNALQIFRTHTVLEATQTIHSTILDALHDNTSLSTVLGDNALWFDINSRNHNGKTVLQEAILCGNVNAIEYLLSMIPDFDVKDSNGDDVFDYLYKIVKVSPETADKILHLMVQNSKIRDLLYNQKKPQKNILVSAFESNNINLLTKLIYWPQLSIDYGPTFAVRKALVKCNVDYLPNAQFSELLSDSALQTIASSAAAVRRLNSDFVIFDVDFFNELLKMPGIETNASAIFNFYKTYPNEKSIYHILYESREISSMDKQKLINRFLELGVNINHSDKHGNTILDYAISHRNVEFVKFLLNNNAIINTNGKSFKRYIADLKTDYNADVIEVLNASKTTSTDSLKRKKLIFSKENSSSNSSTVMDLSDNHDENQNMPRLPNSPTK